MRKKTRLILALDVTEKNKAVSISKDAAEHVDAIKAGYPLVLGAELGIINMISKFAPVIADFKVADIPNTSHIICSQAFEAGASAVIVHGFTGSDSLLECVKTGKEYNGEIFVVTEMSHPGAVEFMAPKTLEIAKGTPKNNMTNFQQIAYRRIVVWVDNPMVYFSVKPKYEKQDKKESKEDEFTGKGANLKLEEKWNVKMQFGTLFFTELFAFLSELGTSTILRLNKRNREMDG